jgi:putative ABC transport system permease protein
MSPLSVASGPLLKTTDDEQLTKDKTMNTVWHDLRYGARMLMKKPGFTLIAVMTLALGIGANTAIFSIVNAVLLKSLPFAEPDRLIRLFESNPQRGWPEFSASAPNFKDWQRQQSVFEQLAALELWAFNLTEGEPERVAGTRVTANLFPLLGVTPALGRSFLREEEQAGRHRVVMLSHGLWQRRFGGNPDLLGKTIQLSGEGHTVVGIMPPNFQLTGNANVWVPLVLDPATEPWRANRANHNLLVIGRLKPGVSFAQAQAHMDGIARQLEQQYPASNAGWGIRLRTVYDWIIPENVQTALLVLLGAVGFVLLIACANVANLFLARATLRQREVAIRSALGASRRRVVQQFLTESGVLALLGGGAGVLLAMWGVDVLVTRAPINIPRLTEAAVDRRVLVFSLGVSLLTSLLFGFVPALQASRPNLSEAFKEGGRTSPSGARHRVRSVLVVAEIALALVLLVGAGLLIQSFVRLQNVSLGFNPENVLTLQMALPTAQYREPEKRTAFYAQLVERLRSLPGVMGAAAISQVPFQGGNWAMEVAIEGREASPQEALSADARAVTPNYFRTMGIPLLQGRDFTEHDGPDSTNMIISEEMARRFWPNENPIGKRFRPGVRNPWMTVVGVVGNVRNLSLNQDPRPAFYFSSAQLGFDAMAIVVRAAGNPENLIAAVRGEVAVLDKALPISAVRTMQTILSTAAGQSRFQTMLLGLFAALALILATVGVFGVISYSVSQRTHEIGIRVALGAGRRDVLRLVVGQGMILAVIGVAIGVAGALALTRVMKGLLYGVSPTDPTTFALISLLLTGVALLASYIPARRATKVDPMVALRYE